MPNVKEIKNRALATIDAATSVLNRFPDLGESNILLSYNTSTNPFQFLMDLFKTTTGYNKLISILGKFISYELPVVEAAVKTLLITKLKDIISCSVNPFFTEEILRDGITFNVEEIDISDILKYSPLDKKVGRFFYFATEKAKMPDDLITCDDMDAFIWFIINKANRRYVWKPKKNRTDEEWRRDYPNGNETDEQIIEIANTKFETQYIELEEAKDSQKITQEEYEKQLEKLNKKKKNYINNFFKLKKEDGIVTFEYHERATNLKDAYGDKYYLQTPYNSCLHVFIGDVREKQSEILALRNKETEHSQKEKDIKILTNKIENKRNQINLIENEKLALEQAFESGKINVKDFKKEYKKLDNKIKNIENNIDDLIRLRKEAYAAKQRFIYEIDSIKTQIEETGNQFFPFLTPKKNRNYYYGKSLIEFNVDYVSSLKLFDEKAVAARLLDALTGVLQIDLGITYKLQIIRNEVKKMVSMITESDDLVVSDCFFTFSNDDYDAMSRQAELRKAGLLAINGDETSAVKIDTDKIFSLLNNINESSNKETIQTVIEGTITELSKDLSSTTYTTDENVNYGVQMLIIENLLNSLAYVLVCSILSPKVYLLLLINLKIVGRETNFDLEGFIGQYKQLMADLIRSIRDQLLDYLMGELKIIIGDLVKEVTIKLSIEQARYYARLIKRLIDCFKRFRSKNGSDFNVDDIDYADILPNEQEEPKNNDC